MNEQQADKIIELLANLIAEVKVLNGKVSVMNGNVSAINAGMD